MMVSVPDATSPPVEEHALECSTVELAVQLPFACRTLCEEVEDNGLEPFTDLPAVEQLLLDFFE